MDFAGEFIAERLYNIQEDVRVFMYVVSHVCNMHRVYDYIRQKFTYVLTRNISTVENARSFSSFTLPLPKLENQTIWDLQHILLLLQPTNDHVVFRCSTGSICRTTDERMIVKTPPRSCDSSSQEKIARLEQEVEALKRKLAAILTFQSSSPVKPKQAEALTLNLQTTSFAPPPAPPPLPPLNSSANPMDFIKKQILKNKSNSLKEPERGGAETPLMSLGDIMKSARGVKLRHVERSPGGTPLRRPPLHSPNDLHVVLTQAMKRRYELIYPEESPHRGDGQWSPSPVRNNLGRKSSRPSLSPLQEIAC